MTELEKAILELKEDKRLIERLAKLHDTPPTRIVRFSEEVEVTHYVHYEIPIPSHIEYTDEAVAEYIEEHKEDEIQESLTHSIENEEWDDSERPKGSGSVLMTMITTRGDDSSSKSLGEMDYYH
jgi:hypothetical protein